MKIVIIGCGKIGCTVIESLLAEGHEIAAMDNDPEVLSEITNIYDVMTVCGSGTDADALTEAQVAKSELVIAVTGSDEFNMLSCFIARRLGAKHTIARIRNPEYNDKSLAFLKKELHLSMVINPESFVARELFNVLKLPSAVKVETFSRGSLEMIELKLKENSPLDGLSLSELKRKHPDNFLICAVERDGELWCFLGVVAASVAVITFNIRFMFEGFSDSLRAAAFQVASIISTTGYVTAVYNSWPQLSKSILLILMFIGGCAGSTAGGIKVSRVVLYFKLIKNELKRMIHPRSVSALRFEGKTVEGATRKSVSNYFLIYSVCFFAIFLALSIEPFDFETNFSAVAACFNNVGPGFAGVGPTGNFADYSNFSKLVLSLAMLLGRLEIYPIIIALSPSSWSRKR